MNEARITPGALCLIVGEDHSLYGRICIAVRFWPPDPETVVGTPRGFDPLERGIWEIDVPGEPAIEAFGLRWGAYPEQLRPLTPPPGAVPSGEDVPKKEEATS